MARNNRSNPGVPSNFSRRGTVSFGVGAHFAGINLFSAGLNEVTGGLIALKGAISLVETGLNVLSKSATELVGAISKLGGARGIQEMMVEAVTNQSLLNQTRNVVSGSERATGGELTTLTEKLSENVQTGAFAKSDWLQAIRQIGIVTGQQRSLDEGTLGTLGKFAVVTGSSIEEQGDIFARLKAQHRDLSNEDIIQLMLNAHAVGQKGSFSEAELAKSPLLFGLANMFQGDATTITNMLGTAGSALVSSGGATNQNEAGTMLASIMGAAIKSKNPIWHRDAATGLFTDPASFLTTLVNTREDVLEGELSKNGLGGTPLRKAVTSSINLRAGISNAAGVANDESPEAQSGRSRFIEDMINMHYSMESLQKEFDETVSPQERFRAAFNRIADHLEAKFLGTLQRMQPKLDAFADVIVNHEKDIGDFFDRLAVDLGIAVEILPTATAAIAGLGEAAVKAIVWILSHMPGENFPATFEQASENVHSTTNEIADVNTLISSGKIPADKAQGMLNDLYKKLANDADNAQTLAAIERLSPANLAEIAQKREEQQQFDRANPRNQVVYGPPTPEKTASTTHETKVLGLQERLIKVQENNLKSSQNIERLLQKAPLAPLTSKTGK